MLETTGRRKNKMSDMRITVKIHDENDKVRVASGSGIVDITSIQDLVNVMQEELDSVLCVVEGMEDIVVTRITLHVLEDEQTTIQRAEM